MLTNSLVLTKDFENTGLNSMHTIGRIKVAFFPTLAIELRFQALHLSTVIIYFILEFLKPFTFVVVNRVE